MNNELTTLEFNSHQVQIEVIDNEPWFVAKDVCEILDIRTYDAMARLDEDEKLTTIISLSGQERKVWMINEAGLYSLIFTSRKDDAVHFKRWVTHEVLPTLRKTGRYETMLLPTTSPVQQNTLAAAKQLLLVAEEHETRLDRLENRQAELEARPSLGSPPKDILFPRLNPDHLTIREYCKKTGIKLTKSQILGGGQRLTHYCKRLGIFVDKHNRHSSRYPIPVLQEFFR